jgi:hypothetical protein
VAPAQPRARIPFESVGEAEKKQDQRDSSHYREQGLFDGHAAHRITLPGLPRSFAEASRYDAGYRKVNTFSRLRETSCVASP